MRQSYFAIAVIVLVVLGLGFSSELGPEAALSPAKTIDFSGSPQLNVGINTSTLAEGQALGVSISIANPLSSPLELNASNSWEVNGFPVAMWGGCLFNEPVELVVVSGNVSLGQLSVESANSTTPTIVCLEGGFVDSLYLQPHSDRATLAGTFCTADCSPFQMSAVLESNFSVGGYWTYPLNSSEVHDIYTPVPVTCGGPTCEAEVGYTYAYPEVGPIPAHLFAPGWYTLVVSDEWGQTVSTPFVVVAD